MAVDAVPGGVQDAVLEPFDGDVAGGEGDVLDLVEGLHPVDALGLLGPEAVGIADRAGIHFAVLGVVDIGAFGPIGGYVVNLVGHFTLPLVAAPHALVTASRPDLLQRLCVAGRCPDKAETSA